MKSVYWKRLIALSSIVFLVFCSGLTITAVIIPQSKIQTTAVQVPSSQTSKINSTSVNVWVEMKSNQVPRIYILISEVYLHNLSSNTSELLDPEEPGLEQYYEIYDGDSSTPLFAKVNLQAHSNKSRYAEFDAINVTESTQLKAVCKFYLPNTENWTVNSTTFILKHTFKTEYVAYFLGEMVRISIDELRWTYEGAGFGNMVPPANLTTAKYQIRDNNTDEVVIEGDLKFENGKYFANVPFRRNSGAYYVTFRLNGSFMSEELIIGDNYSGHSFVYKNPFDNILLFIIIGVSVFVILGVIAVIQKKRAEKAIVDRKEPKKAQLEVLDVDLKNLKPTRLEKSAPKKKVEKIDQNALIFNVPTWQVDETAETETSAGDSAGGDAAGATAAAGTAAGTPMKVYNVHCIKCNSWYETDEFEEGLECPKCDAVLKLALWCNNCNVFVEVPKLGEYYCPKCNGKLSISKF